MLLAVVGIVGCSSSATEGASPSKEVDKPQEPVTLQLYYANFTPEEFKLLIADPVKAKYPHITVELKKDAIKTAVTAQVPIDLIGFYTGDWGTYRDLELLYDLNPQIKSSKFDLNRFDQGALKTISALSNKGELYALPFHSQYNALFYNKDIFDRFGVAYPHGVITKKYIEK